MKVRVFKEPFDQNIQIVTFDENGQEDGRLSLNDEVAESLGWIMASVAGNSSFIFEMDV